MKFKEFISALDGGIKNAYLLVGTETFFIDRARDKIFERLGVDKKTELVTLDCKITAAITEVVS